MSRQTPSQDRIEAIIRAGFGQTAVADCSPSMAKSFDEIGIAARKNGQSVSDALDVACRAIVEEAIRLKVNTIARVLVEVKP